ncbi:hypothetical protein Ahy_B08g093168 [Arachis hypogaea]|uniref:TATA-binding protein interacting (TIP20) domain-containing protein n=1 Tax=Arachis hypogaea TaxID=3818 RepID=A0A444Y5C6_ARAHY|nr:hypothetical protein Ahy_B08g093168 [Arachis hypogaea]
MYVSQQELIRTVDLELRKAAFECVDTLLDSCLDQVLNSLGIMSRLINQDQDQEVKDMTTLALELYCTLMSDKRSSPSVGLAVRNKSILQILALILCWSHYLPAPSLHHSQVALPNKLAFNSSMCGCSVPCYWGSEVFVDAFTFWLD